MLKTITVTIAAIILSLLLCSVATSLILNHTQFGHVVMTGDTRGITDPWKTFMSGFWILFFGVSLPTTALVAISVGALTRKYTSIAAAIAVLPISVISSGLLLRDAWVILVLVLTAIAVAALMKRLRKLSREPQSVLNS